MRFPPRLFPTFLPIIVVGLVLVGTGLGCATPEKDAAENAKANVQAAAERGRESVSEAEGAAASETRDEALLETANQIRFGNGSENWITIDGLERSGPTLTFMQARIQGNGWLVLHPFRDGRPDGKVYAGAAYLSSGTNDGIAVTLETEPEAGTMFLVMLHRDVNENREFDFVFVDEKNVLDRAVFEGRTMIAHEIRVP